jgi:hypothetical protein
VINGTSSPIGRPNSGNFGVGAGTAAIETDPSSDGPTCCGSDDERLNPASTSARSASGCGVYQRTGTNREIKNRGRRAERKIVAAIGASFDVLEAEIPAFGTLHGS